MTVADGRPLVLFAENEAYESFLMFAAALRRRGLRVQRLTTRPPDRRARARMLLQRLVFQRIDAVLDRSIRGGGVDTLPLPTSYGGCAALEATEATAQALLRSGRRLGVPKTAHDEHLLYDKLALTRFAEAHGVAVPRTWSRLEDAPDGPLVVKGALGSGGSAVRVAQDRASAQAAWRELAAASDTVFAQEFAGGPVHSVGGVAREGRMVAASAYRSRPADGKPLGPPAAVQPVADRAAMEATERLLGALGYTGMFCLDFVGAEAGGPLLVDLNPRVFGSWAALQRAGVDLVTAYMYAHDLHPTAPAPDGARDGWWATAPFNGYLGKVGEAPTLNVAELRNFHRFLGWRWLTVRLLEVLMTR